MREIPKSPPSALDLPMRPDTKANLWFILVWLGIVGVAWLAFCVGCRCQQERAVDYRIRSLNEWVEWHKAKRDLKEGAWR